MALTFAVSVKSLDITQYSTNSLAVALKRMNPQGFPGNWESLITEPEDNSCQASIALVWNEIKRRMSEGFENKPVREVLSAISATCMVTLAPSKVTKIYTREKKPIATEEFAGVTYPVGYPGAMQKIEAEHIVRASLFGMEDMDIAKKRVVEVSHEAGARIGFPFSSLIGITFPPVERVKIIDTNVSNIVKGDKVLKTHLLDRLSKVAKFKPGEGKFDIKFARKGITDVQSVWVVLEANRKVRGADQSRRHLDTVGYYYGHMSAHMCRAAWAVSDIMRLGKMHNTNCLELTRIEGAVTMYVCQSLISAGWLIRMVNGVGYPQYTGEIRGIFKYFSFKRKVTVIDKVLIDEKEVEISREEEEMLPYLKFVSIDDRPPVVTGDVVKFEDELVTLKQKIKQGKSNLAIPFFYVFLRPHHLTYQKLDEYKDMFPMATAHAHSAQVIFCRGKVQSEFNWRSYMQRISEANACKTFYVYTKERYWERDPYGFATEIGLINLQYKKMDVPQYDLKDDASPIDVEKFLGPEDVNDKNRVNIKPKSEPVEKATVDTVERYKKAVQEVIAGNEEARRVKDSEEIIEKDMSEGTMTFGGAGSLTMDEEVTSFIVKKSEEDEEAIEFEDDEEPLVKNQIYVGERHERQVLGGTLIPPKI